MEKRVQVRKYMLDGCFQELVYLKVYFSNTIVKKKMSYSLYYIIFFYNSANCLLGTCEISYKITYFKYFCSGGYS